MPPILRGESIKLFFWFIVRRPVALFLFLLAAATGLKSCRVFHALNFLCWLITVPDGEEIGYDDIWLLSYSAAPMILLIDMGFTDLLLPFNVLTIFYLYTDYVWISLNSRRFLGESVT